VELKARLDFLRSREEEDKERKRRKILEEKQNKKDIISAMQKNHTKLREKVRAEATTDRAIHKATIEEEKQQKKEEEEQVCLFSCFSFALIFILLHPFFLFLFSILQMDAQWQEKLKEKREVKKQEALRLAQEIKGLFRAPFFLPLLSR
jgi:hypothetical protein